MPDPRDVLPTYGADAVLLGVLAATPVVILLALTVPEHARRAWGWLCERVARAAYQRGYDVGHTRGWSEGYASGHALGWQAGESRMKRENARELLGLPAKAAPPKPATPRASPWGGRLAHLNPPPGFNDSEGDEVL